MVENHLFTIICCMQLSKHNLSRLFHGWTKIIFFFCYLNRKSLLLAAGILVVGGTTAYVKSRNSSKKFDSFGHYNGLREDNDDSDERVTKEVKKTIKKKGSLKSLHVLASVLLSEMGKRGTSDLFAMIAIAVSLCYMLTQIFLFSSSILLSFSGST